MAAKRNLRRASATLALFGLCALLAYRQHEPDGEPGTPARPEPATAATHAAAGRKDPESVAALQADDESACSAAGPTERWMELSRDEREARLSSTAAVLSASTNAEDLLTSAIIDTAASPTQRAELVSRALAEAPGDPLVAWVALSICSRQSANNNCDYDERLSHTLDVDGGNGVLYATEAEHRYVSGDHTAALQALQRAVAAPGFDTYWIESVRMFDRSLAAASDLGTEDRAFVAIGTGAGLPWNFIGLRDVCRTESSASLSWANACTALGERMAQPGGSVIGLMTGIAMQRNVHEAIGNTQQAEALRIRGDELSNEVIRLTESTPGIFRNPAVLADYLDDIVAHGELEAMRTAEARVQRLRADAAARGCRY